MVYVIILVTSFYITFRARCPRHTRALARAVSHFALDALIGCENFNDLRAIFILFRSVQYPASGGSLFAVAMVDIYTDSTVHP